MRLVTIIIQLEAESGCRQYIPKQAITNGILNSSSSSSSLTFFVRMNHALLSCSRALVRSKSVNDRTSRRTFQSRHYCHGQRMVIGNDHESRKHSFDMPWTRCRTQFCFFSFIFSAFSRTHADQTAALIEKIFIEMNNSVACLIKVEPDERANAQCTGTFSIITLRLRREQQQQQQQDLSDVCVCS